MHYYRSNRVIYICNLYLYHLFMDKTFCITGKPSDLLDETNPDWAPCLKLGHKKFKTDVLQASTRSKRLQKRAIPKVAKASSHLAATDQDANTESRILEQLELESNNLNISSSSFEEIVSPNMNCSLPCVSFVSTATQTDLSVTHISQMEKEICSLREEKEKLKSKQADLSVDNFTEHKIQFYTGLPSKNIFSIVFEFIQPRVTYKPLAITLQQSFLLFLMKLRLNLLLQDLAFRFLIAQSTVTRIFDAWLDAAFASMLPTLIWPDRNTLRETMPTDFKVIFQNNIAVIIDCFEIMIDRPTSLCTRGATWSNYKHHNTIKFLIGIALQSVITFVSEAWGGRASDKHITENCGILEKLMPGDYVMADRGFNIGDAVGFYCAQLVKPASARGKQQLSPDEVEKTRSLASLRIHVERVIGNLRQKYTILKGQLPIEYLTCREGEENAPIDKIVKICSAFTNLSKPIISLA